MATTRRRYARGGNPVREQTLFDPQSQQLTLLQQELNRAKSEEALASLAEDSPEKFIELAAKMIAENHPDSARLKDLSEVAKQRVEEKQWETDIKSGAGSYEEFLNYLEQRLSGIPSGNVSQGSHLVQQIAAVTEAIKARDEAIKDRGAMLSYLKTEDNVTYAEYLRDKLTRSTDPAMQKALITQINDLSSRQDKKEAVARTVARQQSMQSFMGGVSDVEATVMALSKLRDQSGSPEEATAVQKDINSIFQTDIAKKRNSALTNFALGKVGAAQTIAILQTLANGPADESSINALTTAIDHVRSVAKEGAASAATAGIQSGVQSANAEYNAAVGAINSANRENRAPTEVEIRRVKEAGDLLAVAEQAIADNYFAHNNPTSGEVWANRAKNRPEDVNKVLMASDDMAFKRAGVTATDSAAFDTSISQLDSNGKMDAIISELNRLNTVTGITSEGGIKAKDIYEKTLARGQAASDAAKKMSDEEQGKLVQVYADYKSRGGTLPDSAFQSYLSDLNKGVIDLQTFNGVMGFGDVPNTGLLASGSKPMMQPDGKTPAAYGQGDRVLTDAFFALRGGDTRSQSLSDQLAQKVYDDNIARDRLTKSQTSSYQETMRETLRGKRNTIEPIMMPVADPQAAGQSVGVGSDPSGLGLPPDIAAELAMLRASQQKQQDKTADPWTTAYDSLNNQTSYFDIPHFNLPDLPPPSPLVFLDAHERATKDQNYAPLDFGGTGSTDFSQRSGERSRTIAPPDIPTIRSGRPQ